jgi:chromosomal replication initiation ATPase DnaA
MIISIKDYCKQTGISEELLLSKSRTVKCTIPRQLYWKHLRENGHTHRSIARLFNKSHSTIISGIRHVDELIDIKDRDVMFMRIFTSCNPDEINIL